MNKKVFRLIAVLTVLTLMFPACEKEKDPFSMGGGMRIDFERPDLVIPGKCGELLKTPLLAGKTNEVGFVTVVKDGPNLIVTFKITDPSKWLITETHLSVTTALGDVPGYPGNPKIGNFNFNGDNNNHPGVASFTYPAITIPAGANSLYILAHAVVKDLSGCEADWNAFNSLIPTSLATANVEYGKPQSYFLIDILNDGIFNGNDHEGWCIDLDHQMGAPTSTSVKFISTYQSNFADLVLVDLPENIKAVNWLLNQDFVGKHHPTLGDFTVEDVQTAIWKLIETTSFIADGADLNRTNYLFSRALEHKDFTPECGDLVGIVLLPVDEVGVYNNKQIALITYPLPCECGDETAWAAGSAFPGDSWAMYFQYCVK